MSYFLSLPSFFTLHGQNLASFLHFRVKNYMHALKTLGVKCFFFMHLWRTILCWRENWWVRWFQFQVNVNRKTYGQNLHASLEESRCEMFFSFESLLKRKWWVRWFRFQVSQTESLCWRVQCQNLWRFYMFCWRV